MPLYEYKCQNCGSRFEALQRFSDEPLTIHETCGGGPVERLLSAPSFQFKGTGWYVTDYGRGKNGKSQKENQDNKESKQETPKTEVKPAASEPAAKS